MKKRKTYSGFTKETAENLLLDAGAFFKNFNAKNDDFDTAVKNGKLLGATKDGGEFSAVPEIRQIPIDGVKGKAKGLDVLDAWDVYIKANVLEIKKETLAAALCASEIDETSDEKYDIITANNYITLDDYIENITWVGTLSGSTEPVIIQVYNALNTEGLKLATKDKDQSVVAMNFSGRYDANDLDTPPFKIMYPKRVKVSPTTTTVSKANLSDVVFTVTGGTVENVTVNDKELTKDTDYTVADKNVTIKNAVYTEFTEGTYEVIIGTSNGYARTQIVITA